MRCRQLGLELVLDRRQIVVDRLEIVNAAVRLVELNLRLLARADRVVERRFALLKLGGKRRNFALSECILKFISFVLRTA